MNKREWFKIAVDVLIVILIYGLVVYFDKDIVFFITGLRTPALDSIFLGITLLGSSITIFFIITSLLLWASKKRFYIAPLWIILAIDAALNLTMKAIAQRNRPFQIFSLPQIPILLQQAWSVTYDYSFPSFHAMMVFSTLPILDKEFPRFKYLWITLAGMVAFSRIYFGLHYMSDVVFGCILGYAIGWIILNIYERDLHKKAKDYLKKRREKKLMKKIKIKRK